MYPLLLLLPLFLITLSHIVRLEVVRHSEVAPRLSPHVFYRNLVDWRLEIGDGRREEEGNVMEYALDDRDTTEEREREREREREVGDAYLFL